MQQKSKKKNSAVVKTATATYHFKSYYFEKLAAADKRLVYRIIKMLKGKTIEDAGLILDATEQELKHIAKI